MRKRPRLTNRSTTLRPLLVCAAAAVIAGLAGCDLGDPLGEYRGVDILESRGLTIGDGEPGYLPGPRPDGFDYIRLEPLSAAEYGTANGLPDGASVYRLELLNLLPDGDFEEGPLGALPLRWESSAGGTVEVSDAATEDFGTGNQLSFNVSANQEWGRIDLNAHLLDGLVGTGAYHIQFEILRRATDAQIILDFGSDDTAGQSYLKLNGADWVFQTDGEVPRVEAFPRRDDSDFDRPGAFYANAAGTGFLYVGSPYTSGPSDGYVDSIRIGRTDIMPHWAIELPAVAETGLDLVPGRYSFRAYVKAEIADEITPASPNRFRSGALSVGANNDFAGFPADVHEWTSTEWVEIVHEFVLRATDLDAGLVLQLTPSTLDVPSVGSVLIAAPILELAE